MVDVPNNDAGGLASWFSAYGPSNDMLFKPAVATPGGEDSVSVFIASATDPDDSGNIISTWPLDFGGWALNSGTSMATPFVRSLILCVTPDEYAGCR